MNLQIPITQMKEEGNWPLSWTSAVGLVPEIKKLGDNIVGCELGVSYGFNLVYFLEQLPNISKVYAIDPYAPYDDGPGGYVDQVTIDKVKELFLKNIEPFKEKVKFLNLFSSDAIHDIPDNALDYIFIDGDHSYKAVSRDIKFYYSKVKPGGIFAGHDYNLSDVKQAVGEFMSQQNIPSTALKLVPNSTWYWIKP